MRQHAFLGVSLVLFYIALGLSPLRSDDDSAPCSTHLEAVWQQDLNVYANVRTVVDLEFRELIAAYPELKKKLTFASHQRELEGYLHKVGKNVEAFFSYFPNTASVEEVRQERLDSRGRLIDRTGRKYQYLMLAHAEEVVRLEEYRTDGKGNPVQFSGLERGFLLSIRFVGRTLHFHPLHQSGSRFRYLGKTSNPAAHVIAFAQDPQTTMALGYFRLPDRNAAILVQGLVWVDPDNFQIIQVHTELLAPRNDIGLQKHSTEIQFGEVMFPQVSRSFWLPREVVVTVRYQGALYRNRHRYKDYKLFTVQTLEKFKPPAVP